MTAKNQNLFQDRRFIISLLSVVCLTFLGYRGLEVSDAIAMISIGLGIANGGEKALVAFASKQSEKKGE